MAGAPPEAIGLGKVIHAVLLTLPRAEAGQLVRGEFSQSSGARLATLVRKVVCQREQKERLVEVDHVLEIKIAPCEVASGDRISEPVRVATIVDFDKHPWISDTV